MKHIVFIVGPALGHVSRCLTIAREITKLSQHKITFIAVKPGYGEKIIVAEYPLVTIGYAERGDEIFADGIEQSIKKLSPDMICVDLTPMKWLTLVRFPDVQTVYITNYFLTNLCDYQTIQQIKFDTQGDAININRKTRGLKELTNIKNLYELENVLLCDPIEFVDVPEKMQNNHHIVGPCFWEPSIELPEEIEPLKDILFVSLGSTGRTPIPKRIIDEIVVELDIQDVIWLGTNLNQKQSNVGYKNHYYSWLPATDIIKRSKFVISQGGSGSTYQAIAHGVPCGIWPTHVNQKIMGEVIEDNICGFLLHENVKIKGALRHAYRGYKANCIGLSSNSKLTHGPLKSAKKIIEIMANTQ